ncbi:hypothetical protein ACEPT8_02345 [Pseudomonas aeruginosa]|uniref:hypothetical protein n=1 Tax=Pseudomonas aeruginosa TaxID=287 RepID=UPI000AE3056A|nr:hypothetical protein [Pseudomonas aeruginosa]MDA3425814.1 hypothetical protein [Pseudomonas aeruginosa]
MACTLYLQDLAKLAGLPFDLGDAAELALLFSENAGLQVDHLLITISLLLGDGGTTSISGKLEPQVIHPPKQQRDTKGSNRPELQIHLYVSTLTNYPLPVPTFSDDQPSIC